MHSTRMEKKSGARKSEMSGENPECPGNPDTLRKISGLSGISEHQ
jgi:hypothetical protein